MAHFVEMLFVYGSRIAQRHVVSPIWVAKNGFNAKLYRLIAQYTFSN